MLAADGAPHVPAATPPAGAVRCRAIEAADFDAIADLLCEGFPRRDRAYWTSALRQLDRHRPPDGLPRYGLMLEADGAAAGVLLLISATVASGERDETRTNFSSWYVRPAFRIYASMLVARALKLPTDGFINVSPAPQTWRTIEAQGFSRFNSGAFAAFPMLSPSFRATQIRPVGSETADELAITSGEWRLLRDHRDFGGISLCVTSGGRGHPFVFRRRVLDNVPLPCAQLVYCRDVGDLARLAGPIGRYLARRGMAWMIVPSDDRPAGMIGRRFPQRMPMYAAGKIAPRPGDLAYTEAALFGL